MDMEKLAIIGHIPPPHPNTVAGWAAYEAEIENWNCNNYGRAVNETRPYPLMPGTSLVVSREFFGCGRTGPSVPMCPLIRIARG